jgi:hypothetical protein
MRESQREAKIDKVEGGEREEEKGQKRDIGKVVGYGVGGAARALDLPKECSACPQPFSLLGGISFQNSLSLSLSLSLSHFHIYNHLACMSLICIYIFTKSSFRATASPLINQINPDSKHGNISICAELQDLLLFLHLSGPTPILQIWYIHVFIV